MAKTILGRVKGLSAYEVWLAQGNSGTMEDYLAAIKGDQGDAFTYDDFTEEQLNNLIGPKGDPGEVSTAQMNTAIDAAIAPVSSQLAEIAEGTGLDDGAVKPEKTSFVGIVNSPNLFDASKNTASDIADNHYIQSGALLANGNYFTSAKIPLSPLTEYTMNLQPWADAVASNARICEFNAQDTYIDFQSTTTFTTHAETAYIRFSVSKSKYTLSALNTQLMIVAGTVLPSRFWAYGEQVKTLDASMYVPGADKQKPIYLRKTNDLVEIVSKYTDTQDLMVRLRNSNLNGLFDFKEFGVIPNDVAVVSNGIASASIFQTVSTDWFSPIIVRAVNNGDGDKPTGYFFTGGAHGYNNQTTGVTPTARQTSLVVRADGRIVDSYDGYCTFVDVLRIARIQASNTEKADGTGREVLEERVRIHFDGHKFRTETEIVALEDVAITTFYGLQCSTSVFGASGIVYKGSRANRVMVANNSNTNSGDKLCRVVKCIGTAHTLEVGIDPGYGMGDFGDNSLDAYSAFATNYNKAYFNVIKHGNGSPLSIPANGMLCFSGFYRVYPT